MWAPSSIFLLICEGILCPGERNVVGSCQPSKTEDLWFCPHPASALSRPRLLYSLIFNLKAEKSLHLIALTSVLKGKFLSNPDTLEAKGFKVLNERGETEGGHAKERNPNINK